MALPIKFAPAFGTIRTFWTASIPNSKVKPFVGTGKFTKCHVDSYRNQLHMLHLLFPFFSPLTIKLNFSFLDQKFVEMLKSYIVHPLTYEIKKHPIGC